LNKTIFVLVAFLVYLLVALTNHALLYLQMARSWRIN
jgi:hypothetical protein